MEQDPGAINRDEFIEFSEALSERQAEAYYRRHIEGDSRQEAAEAMDTSALEIDRLERSACARIRQAANLLELLEGVEHDAGTLGLCAECDQPSAQFRPDQSDERPLRERRMLCPDCADPRQ